MDLCARKVGNDPVEAERPRPLCTTRRKSCHSQVQHVSFRAESGLMRVRKGKRGNHRKPDIRATYCSLDSFLGCGHAGLLHVWISLKIAS